MSDKGRSRTRRAVGRAKKDLLAGLNPALTEALRRLVHRPEGQPAALTPPVPPPPSAPPPPPDVPDIALAELANCVWYLKTRFFKRSWDDVDAADDDPRVRRALSRLQKGIDALAAAGVEVQDRTGQRYPPGGGRLMRPIQLQPTAGLSFEKVVETATPIVFRNGQLIQSGEVFVATPQDSSPPSGDNSQPLE